jgi:[ribosomal protein S18]-alanine N-acetyltransferase
VIRKAGGADAPFLRDMVRHAYYWRWGAPETADVPASRYVEGWGRPGDRGLILLDEGFPVGAAWYRLFTAASPGYAFLDEETPELTIAVVPSRRGRGFGDQLLTALIEQAREDGVAALSLSVEKDNPALKLYERFGFEPVKEMGSTVVMRARLGSSD